MAFSSKCVRVALLLMGLIILVGGCAGGQATQQVVTTEYLLTTAGFQRLAVDETTPKRAALLNNLPQGKISTYRRNGEVYHAYPDEKFAAVYIGDEAAYQKYLSLARGRQLCERVPGGNGVHFWSCMQEVQEGGATLRGK